MPGQEKHRKRNYYEVLGVPRNATPNEIQKAYRELLRKHHPDYNPGDMDAPRRTQEIYEAYDILSDPDKRARYDASLPPEIRSMRDILREILDEAERSPEPSEHSQTRRPGITVKELPDFGVLRPGEPDVMWPLSISWTGDPPQIAVPVRKGI